MFNTLKNHIITYPTPSNITYFWSFGFLAGCMLFNQILTGLFLAMYYMNNMDNAFDSVEFIMRNVNYGWFIRYLHSNGASFFFIILYLHIGKGLYYKSYMYPRHNIWYSGMIIFVLVMGTSFLGYVLPWGQMSFWGATVITSLVTVVPIFGEHIVNWVWGGFSVGNPTLMRFFVIHYLLPFIILAVVMVHIILLHTPGSSNPLNFDKKNEKITFFPYFYFKDLFSLIILLLFFIYVVSYMPNIFNHADNYIKANPMSTPKHIVPEWYFLPFYAILRAISNKSIGIVLFAFSLIIFFLLPLLSLRFKYSKLIKFNYKNKHIKDFIIFKYFFFDFLCGYEVKRTNFKPLHEEIQRKKPSLLTIKVLLKVSLELFIFHLGLLKRGLHLLDCISLFPKNNNLTLKLIYYSNSLNYRKNFWILVVVFIALGYIGQLEVNEVTIELGQNFTVLYFMIIFMLIYNEVFLYTIFNLLVLVMFIKGYFFNGFFKNI